jgi:hypothetical protein
MVIFKELQGSLTDFKGGFNDLLQLIIDRKQIIERKDWIFKIFYVMHNIIYLCYINKLSYYDEEIVYIISYEYMQ